MAKYQILYYLREDGRLVEGNVYDSLTEAAAMAEVMREQMKNVVRGLRVEEVEEA